MSLQELRDLLKEEYGYLEKWSNELYGKAEDVIDKKDALDAKKFGILISSKDDPKRLGSNEETRKAVLWGLCRNEENALGMAEEAEREVKHRLQRTISRIEHLRAQLRILELSMMAT